MSPISYCYKYAEIATWRDLIREYHRLKNQQAFFEIVDFDERQCCSGFVDRLPNTNPVKVVEDRDEVSRIFSNAPKIDCLIMEGVMEGKTLREIGEDLGMSQVAVLKRLKKYRGTK